MRRKTSHETNGKANGGRCLALALSRELDCYYPK